MQSGSNSVLTCIIVGLVAALVFSGMCIALIVIWKKKMLLRRKGNANECNNCLRNILFSKLNIKLHVVSTYYCYFIKTIFIL